MRPTGVHETAVIGSPPEHRDWQLGGQYFLPYIDPSARINAFVTVDGGLKAPTKVGARSFIMAHCHIGHDAQIGEDCELAPGTTIGGHVILGNKVRCGVGVLVKPFVKVGDGARLGMGAVVTKNVPAGEIWVGNPAEEINEFKNKRHYSPFMPKETADFSEMPKRNDKVVKIWVEAAKEEAKKWQP